jgi:hypothetical protein
LTEVKISQKSKCSFHSVIFGLVSKEISTKTKIKIFSNNVKSVLLYGCETWKVAKKIINSLQTFINKYLLHNFWPVVVTNENLWKLAKEESVATTIKRRK